MSTNKTRVAAVDRSNANPFAIVLQTEFDVYDEAIDYVETYTKLLSGIGVASTAFDIYVFSYYNSSYKYTIDASGVAVKFEITFPQSV